MPDGGRIRIVTSNKELLGADARERDLTAGQYICLCVADTGSGMTREVADRAFDPFFTTKPLGQGTGLGLSMIHGFVRQSGGTVLIETAPGEGTSIHIYLPRYFGNLDSAAASEAPSGEEAGLGETVLVIDDEAAVRTLVVEVLQDAGYRVLEAEDGQAGLAILDTDRRIDLLITDVGLPGGVNGRQVADVARLRRPELKVLFITGYAEHAVLGAGRLEPGMQVVTKPFSMAGLGARVREILET
jgi:CheY-like chemotaxis protein